MQVDHPAISGIRLVLGGNVFGWTIDRDASFSVLDTFYEEGGRMIDTAEGYSNWVPGNKGGESEAIIGQWLESRGVRKDMCVATKTGQGGAPGSLAADKVSTALEASLERLRTDYVDLYYAHRDDGTTPLDEVVDVYDAAFRSGKAHELGASNYTAERLTAVLGTADRLEKQPFTVLQPLYNLVDRDEYEGTLQSLAVERGIAVLPYYGLAAGFLSGKYASANDWNGKARAATLEAAAANGGWAVLEELRSVAMEMDEPVASVALAWLNSRLGIAAPISSATTPEQVRELAEAARLQLTAEQSDRLASALPA